MKEDKRTKDKNEPQQRPEDAEKQNAQQEREYREQKNGTMKMPPEQATGNKAIRRFEELKSEEKEEKKRK